MFFRTKTKGFFVEKGAQSLFFARTSAMDGPMVIEQLESCAIGDEVAREEILARIQPKKSPSGYLQAVCGIHPEAQVIRRATLEIKRVKEPGYLEEVCTTQLRVDPGDHIIAVLNANDGTDFDVAKGLNKEALFCGLRHTEVTLEQESLLAMGIYPERLELGCVGALGALTDWLAFSQSKVPTLLMEFGAETTQIFILGVAGVETSRTIAQGLETMLPVLQKELGLKDEEAARRLFYSGAFDFSGLGPALIKKLLKELQSSIGFYEVQTGQSVGQLVCLQLPPVLGWLQEAVAGALGVTVLPLDFEPWLRSRRITLPEELRKTAADARWLGLFGLMARYETTHVAETTPAKV